MAKKDMISLYDKVQKKLSGIKTVADYKTMCKILDEPDYDKNKRTKNSTCKKKQLEYWKMCFNWISRKGSFTNIKIYSKEEYYINMLKQLSKEMSIYSTYSFLDLYSQYTDGEICYITKSDLATAICLNNEEFKKFHYNKISYGEGIENYVLNLRESRYDYISEPKKEIKENISSNSDNYITKRTYHIINDYNLYVTENNNYLIESILKQLTNSRIASSRETYIGGFVDISKIPISADLSDVYQENGSFYLRTKAGDDLLISYEERALTSEEINTFIKLQGQVIASMNYQDYFEVKTANKVQELHDRLLPIIFQRLNVLFVYQAYEIFISPDLIAAKKGSCKQQLDTFLDTVKLKKSLAQTNKNNQQKILDLKQERQKKEDTLDTKKKMIKNNGEIIYSSCQNKKTDEANKKYALSIYNKMNKDLIQVDIDKFLPEEVDSLENCPPVWKKLFDKSYNKALNSKKSLKP